MARTSPTNRRSVLAAIGALTCGSATARALQPAPARPGKARADANASIITTRDGVTLFYRDWGTGPAMVFLAGWGLPSEMWTYQMAPLSERGVRTIAFDRRGHGRSSDPGRGYDYNTLAADVGAVLDALDLRGVTLVAHSMGGAEAVRYLTNSGGGRVSRLVLLAPVTMPILARTADNPSGFDPALVEQMRASIQRDFPKWMEANTKPFVTPDTNPDTVLWLKSLMWQTSMKALIECHRTFSAADFRKELPSVAVPTLVIHGDRDASGPAALTGERVASMIPGAKFLLYPGAPHGLFLTHAERINADLFAFAHGAPR